MKILCYYLKTSKAQEIEKYSLFPTHRQTLHSYFQNKYTVIIKAWQSRMPSTTFKVDSIYFLNEGWGRDEKVHSLLLCIQIRYFLSQFIFFNIVYTVPEKKE